MAEISKFERVSESRVAQLIKLSTEFIKKKIIQNRVSQEKQAERKLQEFREISQVKTRPQLAQSEKSQVARIFQGERFGMGSFKVKEISEGLFGSFAINTF
jgi:hypothetical protein